MATGDVKGCIRKLEQRLRTLNYPRDVDYTGLIKGDPSASLPIISYTFTCYSTSIAEILISFGIELTTKSDLRFIEAVYKVLRDVFNYKPILTKQQFLQCAFSERKIQIICDIVDCVVKKHKEITGQNKVKSQLVKKVVSAKDQCEVFYPEDVSVQPSVKTTQKKPLVERHAGSEFLLPTKCYSSALVEDIEEEEPTSDSEGGSHLEHEMESPFETAETTPNSEQIELLRKQLAECQEKLQRLDCVEQRLQSLETSMKGKIIIDETDWNNLLSRVLLLETEGLLQSKKTDFSVPSEFACISEQRTSSRMTNEICSNLKTKADIPESHHQSSGYSFVLSADTSPIAIDINYSSLTEDSNETTKQRMERITKMMEETSKLLKCSNNT
ncbi:centrosomal protein of 44 kDa [Xenopus laevis]|uniref:Centrosomal protein of 44 kDa n=1 Tax=Xenopus laevis TaxID=8355 RepID=CEP44_XENLA|nr:centrosomal protein of 44 kDa [Xenopus laevis]A2RVA7.1 RecName: Full=Centrosomal protein of 44 kDa; Short=Cep44 [Xenopus laevis]AAI33259.1 LOC100037156 protein [Xenopus laevis]